MLDAVCMENELWVLAQFEARARSALQELITKHNVQFVRFPDDVLESLRKMSQEVVEEEAKKTPMATKANDSFKAFQKVVGTWGTVSEKAYYEIIQPKYALSKS